MEMQIEIRFSTASELRAEEIFLVVDWWLWYQM
jgi:hypothetical protein